MIFRQDPADLETIKLIKNVAFHHEKAVNIKEENEDEQRTKSGCEWAHCKMEN